MALKPIPPGEQRAAAASASGEADALSEALITGRSPQRDSQGRFLSKGDKEKEPDKAADQGEKPANSKEPPPKAAQGQQDDTPPAKAGTSRRGNPKPYQDQDGTFVIGGKRFASLEQVQQILLSKSGEATAASKRLAELETAHNKLRQDYISAVDVANQWAERGQAAAQGQQGQPGQPGQPAAAQEPPAEPESAFDPRTFRVLWEKHGADEAMNYLAITQRKDADARESALQTRIESMLDERVGPVAQYAGQLRNMQAAAAYLRQAATKYPELADEQARASILSTWRGLSQDMMFDADLRGIDYAVLKHRTESAGDDTQRAEGDDLDLLSGLGLDDVPFTMEGDAGGDLPRPGEGGARKEADLSEQLIGSSAGSGDMGDDASFMPTP